jgi:TP901 family phage tail tape measure protein
MSMMGSNQQELLFILKMRDEATRVLNQHGQSLRQTGQEAKRTKADLNDMARSVRDVTVAIGAMVGAFVTLRRSAEDFRGFEKGMANVGTLIPGATGRVKELGLEVRKLSVEAGTDFNVLTDGLYQVVSAFGDSSDAMDQLRIANEAAIAGLSTTQEAVSLLSSVTKAYGDTSAAAQEKVSDLAFQTVKLGETTFPELARSMFQVTGMAATLGVSQEELFGVFATGTGVLGGASEVATSFRQVLQGFLVPTEDMKKLMAELGYASGEAMLGQLGLQGALTKVRQAADQGGRSIASYVTGVNGINAALTLTGAQADVWARKTAAMYDVAGSRLAAYQIQQDTLDGSLRKLGASVGFLSIEFGEALSPALRSSAEQAQALVRWFMELDPELRTAIASAAGLTAGLATTVVAVRGLVVAFRLLGLTMVATPWGLALAAAAALGIGMLTLAGYMRDTQNAQATYNDALEKSNRLELEAAGLTGDLAAKKRQQAHETRQQAIAELELARALAESSRQAVLATAQGQKRANPGVAAKLGEAQRLFEEASGDLFKAMELAQAEAFERGETLGIALEAALNLTGTRLRAQRDFEEIKALQAKIDALRDYTPPAAPAAAQGPVELTIGGGVTSGLAADPKDLAAAAAAQARRDDFIRDIRRQTELLREEAAAIRESERAYQDWQLAREIEGPAQAFLDRAQGLEFEKGLVEGLTDAYREQALARQEAASGAEAQAFSEEFKKQIELLNQETAALLAGEAAYAEWQKMRAIEAPLEQFARMAEGLRLEQDAVEELTGAYREAALAKGEAADAAADAAVAAQAARQLSADVAGAFTNAAADMLLNATSLDEALSNLAMRLAEVLMQAAFITPMQNVLTGAMMGMFASAKGNAFLGGEIVPMAKGGTGDGIIRTPTLFPMRSGNVALGGELADEAILPLSRLPNGDLGVQALGGGGGGGAMVLNVNTSVTVEGGSQGPEADRDLATRLGRQVEQAVDAAVARNLRQQLRAGNMLNPVGR